MTTRRTMVWLMLMLVTVPTVAAAADTMQRMADGGAVIQAGSFHEGERFTYDLTFRSMFHGIDATVEEYLVVDVGTVHSMVLADGEEATVVPIDYEMKTPPWRAAVGETDERIGTVYVRIPDATVVRTEEVRHTIRFDQDVEGRWERIERNETELTYGAWRHGPLNGSISDPLTAGTMRAGDTFVHANEVVRTLLFFAGIDGGHVYGTGMWQGDEVYQVAKSSWTLSDVKLFSCSLSQPAVRYWDPLEGDQADRFDGTMEIESWFHPRYPLPVASSCSTRYTDGEGSVEEIDLRLILVDHRPGTTRIPMKHDHSSVPRPSSLETRPVILPGLPATGDMDTVFPAEDAAAILQRAPELVRFRDEGEVPFFVTGFTHDLRLEQTRDVVPTSTVPDPLGVLPQSVDEDAAIEASWWMRLENADHEQLTVRLTRTVDATGEVLQQDLNVESRYMGGVSANGIAFTADDYPKHMVSMGRIVDAWRTQRGMTAEQWDAQEHRSISVDHVWGVTGAIRFVTPSYEIMSGEHVGAPGEFSWRSHTGVFDAVDGAFLSEQKDSDDREQATGRPPAMTLFRSEPAVVVASGHVPTAATASGLAVALAFVVAYFWDGIGRVIVAPMYAKIHKDKVLDHDKRDRIVDYVTANPGATLGAVREHLGSGYGTVVHHLGTLERNGLLTSRKVGRIRSYFPSGTLSPHQMDAVATAGTDAAGRFLRAVTAEPGLTQGDIAARLGVADSSVRYQAKRLLAHAQVRIERDGRQVRYYPVGQQEEA